MKRLLTLVLMLTLALAVGCGGGGEKAAQKTEAKGPVKVGIVLPLTGKQAKFGEIEKQSFDMALEEINAAGGVNGQQLVFLYEDDTGVPATGSSVAEKLINKDQVVMLGGGYSSSVCKSVARVSQQNKMPFLINTGSADDITEKGYDYVFRLNPPASEYAKGTESFLSDIVKPATAVTIYENSDFGTKSSEEFTNTCKKLGINVLFSEGFESGTMDFRPILIKAKEANPDLVYMVAYVNDAPQIMKQAKELQLQPKMFLGNGAGFTMPSFPETAGNAAEAVFSTTLWYQTLNYPGAKDYYDKFMKRFGKETEYHGAEAYSAAYVMADALKRAKSFSPDDVRQALAETDMMTVFGPVKFQNYNNLCNQNSVDTYLTQWINGQLALVWPTAAASAPYVYPVEWDKVWNK
ncbi:MAG: ABC transporter substrate-binding protein [Desulfovibrionaceae bacterium]